MTTGDRESDPILASLQGTPISHEEAEAFDATVDRLDRVITYLTGAMAEIEATSTPESEQLAGLSARRNHYIREVRVP